MTPAPQFAPTPARLDWWLDGRFGVSYHWGLYSGMARGEWVRSAERLSVEAYQPAFDRFAADRFDPRQWAKAARGAGATYAILTTKHHDGFCLFDSALTQYKATNTPAQRDLVREYVDAFRAEGLRVGLYYSLIDWHHPDFPAYGDRQHPMRHNADFKGRAHNWDNYVRYMHGQIRELLTNYGKIDLLTLDFSYWEYTCEKWGATELYKMIRALQPEIVLNDRLGNGQGGILKDAQPPAWAGDYDTCEMNLPHRSPTNAAGQILPWDCWITFTNSWCYAWTDRARKSPADIVRTLVNCVSKNGNLTLNFGPDARGQIDEQSYADLAAIGRWLATNGESVYGCGMSSFERPDWGRFTQSRDGKRLYAHLIEQPIGQLTLPHMRGKVRNPRLLATSAECVLADFWNLPVQQYQAPDDVFLSLTRATAQTQPNPDPIDTVVVMDVVPQGDWEKVGKEQTAPPEVRVPF
jgi:alpha-L-fucosidase